MNVNVLRSYLVSVGWEIDNPSLNKFQKVLLDTTAEVESHTAGVAKLFVGMAATIVGAYATIGGATLALMDHVAQSDLGFQLFALRMHTSTQAAKEMKIATDALGYSLDEITWNRELRGRYFQLVDDQARMQGELGPDFEKSMRGIRDVRFELTRLYVEGQYVAAGVAMNLAKAFGLDTGEGGILERLQHLNEYIITHMPEIASWISAHLVPVLHDIWNTMREITSVGLQMIGVVFGDNRLKSGEISFKNFAIAVSDVDHAVHTLLNDLQALATFLGSHPVISKMVLGAAGGAVAGSVVPGVGSVTGAAIGATAGGVIGQSQKIIDSNFGDADWEREMQNRAAAAQHRQKIAWAWGQFSSIVSGQYNKLERVRLASMIKEEAKKQGVPESLALSIAYQESGLNPNIAQGSKGEIGPFQLMAATARELGVKDRSDLSQNVMGGIKLIKQLLAHFHGNYVQAIAAYNNGNTARTGLVSQSVLDNYVRPVESRMGMEVNLGGITIITGDKNADAKKIGEEVGKKVGQAVRDNSQLQSKQALRTGTQTAGSY